MGLGNKSPHVCSHSLDLLKMSLKKTFPKNAGLVFNGDEGHGRSSIAESSTLPRLRKR